jgi:hypothetical protein
MSQLPCGKLTDNKFDNASGMDEKGFDYSSGSDFPE